MGVIWLRFLSLVISTNLVLAVAIPVQAQEVEGKHMETCPLPRGWDPMKDLLRILAEHREWVARWKDNNFSQEWLADHPEGRANLCNADLGGAQLNQTDLSGAQLNQANLSGAQLNQAFLSWTELNYTNLGGAQLNQANLSGAKLNYAFLSLAQLNHSYMFRAQLNHAILNLAQLNQADMREAQLNYTDLSEAQLIHSDIRKAQLSHSALIGANLNQADMREAQLNYTDLSEAQLDQANLSRAQLNQANLTQSSLKDTHLAEVNLTGATYAPASLPPDAYVVDIRGLQTAVFPKGREIGLVQLRELFQKAGLRDLEREATYALESNRTWHAVTDGNLLDALEGDFRFIAFDLTTGYGLHPGRALGIIVLFGIALTCVYTWVICLPPRRPNPASGIYRIWPTDRIEVSRNQAKLANSAKVERLYRDGYSHGWSALGYAAYFSLLSAFHIGWRDLNVGTWIARIQAREYTLRATGWVRVVSGLQSLLSVYLLAIWALTYFGRPFQ